MTIDINELLKAGLAHKIYGFNILIIMYIKGNGHDMLCM